MFLYKMLKRYWKIIIVAFFVIALALVGYFAKQYFSAKNKPENPTVTSSDLISSSSTADNQPSEKISLKKISDRPVFDFFGVSTTTEEIIYVTPSGEVYRASENEDTQLSKQSFSALNSIAPSPDRQKILAAFGDPNQPQWLVFDLIDKAWRPLPNTIRQAIWGANSNEVIVISQKNANKDLVRLKVGQNSFSEDVIWANFPLQDIDLIYISAQTLLIAEKPAFFHKGRAWELNLKTNELSLAFGPAYGLWLRQTIDRTLVMKYDNNDYLSIVSPTKTASWQTLPEKCESGEGKIYCFLPISWPENAEWPDDYIQKTTFTEDQFFVFEENGDKSLGLGNNEKIDGLKPTIIKDSLYFLNRRDSSLYQLMPFSQTPSNPVIR